MVECVSEWDVGRRARARARCCGCFPTGSLGVGTCGGAHRKRGAVDALFFCTWPHRAPSSIPAGAMEKDALGVSTNKRSASSSWGEVRVGPVWGCACPALD